MIIRKNIIHADFSLVPYINIKMNFQGKYLKVVNLSRNLKMILIRIFGKSTRQNKKKTNFYNFFKTLQRF